MEKVDTVFWKVIAMVRFRLKSSTCLGWVVFQCQFSFSKPLFAVHLVPPCVCTTKWLVWDLCGGVSFGSFLEVCQRGSYPYMHSLEVNSGINKPLYMFAFSSSSLGDLPSAFCFPQAPNSLGFGYPALLGPSTTTSVSRAKWWENKERKEKQGQQGPPALLELQLHPTEEDFPSLRLLAPSNPDSSSCPSLL